MTKEEFEKFLLKKIKEIKAVYDEYCPEDPYLTMCINASGSIHANNSYWKDGCEHKVLVYESGGEK